MNRRQFLASSAAAILVAPAAAEPSPFRVRYFDLPAGTGPHDVTPAPDGSVWFTGQRNGTLGRLDPRDGSMKPVGLGKSAAPHGVTIGPDGAAWVTEGGQNAIARVDEKSHKVDLFKLPAGRDRANLNTPVFDKAGMLWFSGQNGIIGRHDPASGKMDVFDAPRGAGPYGMTRTPGGEIWFASLAGNYIARINTESGAFTVIDPPTQGQGARRVWSDSKNRIWVSEWNSGQVSSFDTESGSWKGWKLPGHKPRTYSVYVDDADKVWLTDFALNSIVRFDPLTEEFNSFPSDRAGANVRQMDGRSGEAWGGESGTDRLVRIQTVKPA